MPDATEPSARAPLKLLVFAHAPPPHHGQSYMVQLMLAGFGGDRVRVAPGTPPPEHGVECYHVNARFSDDLEDVGGFRFIKLWRLLGYCVKAVHYRFRFGIRTFYYVPAPPQRTPLFRDWLVLLLCRPFFPRLILHWHAVGLGAWLESQGALTRWLTHRLLDDAEAGIVLSSYVQDDAAKFRPRRLTVVANGIPDPCPDFHHRLAPTRRERLSKRQPFLAAGSGSVNSTRVLYLAHCVREKGLFDTLEAVAVANETLISVGAPARFQLTVAGSFVDKETRAEFDKVLCERGSALVCDYVGFASDEQKHRLFRDADLFLFPTFFANEGQPVSLIEAMAYGLPVITTRWRSIPECLPLDYAGLVEPRRPDQIAAALLDVARNEDGSRFREIYEREFSLGQHLTRLANAL